MAPENLPGLLSVAERDALLLAPYAMHSRDSAGRRYAEPDHPYRGIFQRDRDRILHSSAFRRLSGKMQVFTGDMGDYHRTRLTHTHEVASIARTLGRSLRLNEDLIEALALLHDIGHAPYGHAGEDALDECLAGSGGFSHNDHALTIVEHLEERYHTFPGLNLSHEVLAGQATRIDKSAPGRNPLLEVQVVDVADSITYDAHDTDDAIKLGIVTLEQLATTGLIGQIISGIHRRWTGLQGEMLRQSLVRELIDFQVNDVLRMAGGFLARCGWCSAEDARRADFLMGPGPALAEQKRELEAFLFEQVYRHPRLLAVRAGAQQRLKRMYQGYLRRPELLPEKFLRRSQSVGLARSVGEHLAGMTDRFCDQQYERHFA